MFAAALDEDGAASSVAVGEDSPSATEDGAGGEITVGAVGVVPMDIVLEQVWEMWP